MDSSSLLGSTSYRIDAILTGQLKDPETDYSEFRARVNDENNKPSSACHGCGSRFGLVLNRRHHCRICRQEFCTNCLSPTDLRLQDYGVGNSNLRCCQICYKAFVQRAQSHTMTIVHNKTQISQSKFNIDDKSHATGEPSNVNGRRRPKYSRISSVPLAINHLTELSRSPADTAAANLPSADRVAIFHDQFLRSLWLKMITPPDSLTLTTHRYHFRLYDNCIPASQVIDWLLTKQQITKSRVEVAMLGQKLVDAGYLKCVTTSSHRHSYHQTTFQDNSTPYRPEPSSSPSIPVRPVNVNESAIRNNTDRSVNDAVNDDIGLLLKSESQWLKEMNLTDDNDGDSISRENSLLRMHVNNNSTSSTPRRSESQSVFYVTEPQQQSAPAEFAIDDDDDADSNILQPSAVQLSSPPINHQTNNSTVPVGGQNLSASTSTLAADRDAADADDFNDFQCFTMPFVDATVRFQFDNKNHDQHAKALVANRKQFERLFMQRFDVMLQQQLVRYRLRTEWLSTIKSIAEEVATRIKPHHHHHAPASARIHQQHQYHQSVNILDYVHIKKLPSADVENVRCTDCSIIYGVVFSKHVVNKLMRKNIDKPAVCLFDSALEYYNDDMKSLSSPLDPGVVQQEHKFQENLVSQLTQLKPDVLVVQNGVSRLAQEFLLEQNVSVLQNTKPSVLKRLARHTDAVCFSHAQQNITTKVPPRARRLGTCARFRIVEERLHLYSGDVDDTVDQQCIVKPLAIFDGCPAHLGCTILLRGDTHVNLMSIKRIMRLAILYCYNRQFEAAFLVNESAQPPAEMEELVMIAQREPIRQRGGLDFRDAVHRVAASLSPFVEIRRPFAESYDAQHTGYLRPFLPVGRFWSVWTAGEDADAVQRKEAFRQIYHAVCQQKTANETKIISMNDDPQTREFLHSTLTQSAKHAHVQSMLAHLRSQFAYNWRSGGGVGGGGGAKRGERRLLSMQQPKHVKVAQQLRRRHRSYIIDCLDPMNHTRLSVLHSICVLAASSPSVQTGSKQQHQRRATYCVPPHVLDMKFYADNDDTIGRFLEEIFSDHDCTTCGQPNVKHVNQFVHNGLYVRLLVHNVAESSNSNKHAVTAAGASPSNRSHATEPYATFVRLSKERNFTSNTATPVLQPTFVWNHCNLCSDGNNTEASLPAVVLDEEAQKLSLAKYLELHFAAPTYLSRSSQQQRLSSTLPTNNSTVDTTSTRCGHSLHQAYTSYFLRENRLAVVKFGSAGLKLIRFPAKNLSAGSSLAHNCAALLLNAENIINDDPPPNRSEADYKAVLTRPIAYDSRSKSFVGLADAANNSTDSATLNTANSGQNSPSPHTLTLIRSALVKQIKEVIVAGHGVFNCIRDKLDKLSSVCGAEGSASHAQLMSLKFSHYEQQREFKERHEALQVKLTSPWLRHAGELTRQAQHQSRKTAADRPPSASVAVDAEHEQNIIDAAAESSAGSVLSDADGSSSNSGPNAAGQPNNAMSRTSSYANISTFSDDKSSSSSGLTKLQRHEDRNAVALRVIMKIESGLFELKKSLCETARTWTLLLPEWLQNRKKEERDERKYHMRHTATAGGELARLLSTSGATTSMLSSSKSARTLQIPAAAAAATAAANNSESFSTSITADTDMPSYYDDDAVNSRLVRLRQSKSSSSVPPPSSSVTFEDYEDDVLDEIAELTSSKVADTSDSSITTDTGLFLTTNTPSATDDTAVRFSPESSPQPPPLSGVRGVDDHDNAGVDSSMRSSSSVAVAASHDDDADARVDYMLSMSMPATNQPFAPVHQQNVCAVIKSITPLINSPIPFPFHPSQHYLLPATHERYACAILDDEPSSLIAFTLACVDYNEKLLMLSGDHAAILTTITTLEVHDEEDESLSTANDENLAGGRARTKSSSTTVPRQIPAAISSSSGKTLPAGLTAAASVDKYAADTFLPPSAVAVPVPPLSPHIEIQFSDPSSRFFCRVYFAGEFYRLRQIVLAGEDEDRFVCSLSRSVRWNSSGGKSGSEFYKTLDERFIIKQINKYEMESFLEFGSAYVEYVLERLATRNDDSTGRRLPLSLAKILGVYHIDIRNMYSSTSIKQDVLVMENLFYKRTISQVYDLKGSLRNRLAAEHATAGRNSNSTSAAESSASTAVSALDQVLLDENYVRLSIEAPLYVRPEVKRCLNAVMQCDSQFLMSHAVMDYSLLVGIDETRHELVVGIIDYIRTFTWHKRLEMMVKSSGLLGGQGLMPTIVSPHLYRTRFCEAMQRYFLPVPDKWYHPGDDADDTNGGDVGGGSDKNDEFLPDDNVFAISSSGSSLRK